MDNVNPQAPISKDYQSRNYAVVIVSVVVVLGAIIFFYFRNNGNALTPSSRPPAPAIEPPTQAPTSSIPIVDPFAPVRVAPSVELARGFPKELILDENAVITSSTRILDAGTKKAISTVIFTSAKPFSDLVLAYEKFFKTGEWILVAYKNSGPDRVGFFAKRKNAESELFVTIIPVPRSAQNRVVVALTVPLP